MTTRPHRGISAHLQLGIAQVLMFACIGLLQVTSPGLFLPLLLAMHAGILLFVSLRRALPRDQPATVRITRGTYALMAMYLPIMLYKLSGRLDLLAVHRPVLHAATSALSILAALWVIYSLCTFRLPDDGQVH